MDGIGGASDANHASDGDASGGVAIPTVDLGPLLAWLASGPAGGARPPTAALAVCGAVGGALESVGFFNAVGLGGDFPPRLAALRRAAEAFFGLPEAEKCEIAAARSAQYRGYSAVGAEVTNGRADVKEGIDMGTHVETEFPPGDLRGRVIGPNQYPRRPSDFRAVVEAYMTTWTRLLVCVCLFFFVLIFFCACFGFGCSNGRVL
eukprot:TRINITY_DN5396_c1_g1_i2.p2 TRINITY_DN5396_c1_g1~~TRINITY_DN5396_c1_g1_i2.p2  ORF type:complete len:205 (+),score=50.17 TRINITY_DN5396_c1_g1_i2:176-790(+)